MANSTEQLKSLSDEGLMSDRELLEEIFSLAGFEKVALSEFTRTTLRNPGMI
jgi:hypothetical protein